MSWQLGSLALRGEVSADPDFGPTQGRQWVIDNAGPRTVTDPGGGVSFTTRADLQTKINANPTGTIFVHAAGGTIDWDASVDCGTKQPKIYFLGLAGSTSTVIDGGARGIIGIQGNQTTGAYEIHGGRWTDFGNASAPGFNQPIMLRDNCVLEDFVTDTNRNNGFGNQGSNVTVRFGTTHSNGTCGWQTTEFEVDGPVRINNTYEHIEVYNNNTQHLHPGGFASGVKMLQCSNNVGRYIYCHDNWGFGLWYDTAEGAGLGDNGFEESVSEDNLFAGFFLEGVNGGSFVRRCYGLNNGYGSDEISDASGGSFAGLGTSSQVLVSCADGSLGNGDGIEVAFNDLDDEDGLVEFPLSSPTDDGARMIFMWSGTHHPQATKNVSVHDNRMWLRNAKARVGGLDSRSTKTLWTTCTWESNTYRVLNTTTTHYKWGSGTEETGERTFAQWQAFGNDTPVGSQELI